jgi:D-alanyl-D-alanine carboxypeptidase
LVAVVLTAIAGSASMPPLRPSSAPGSSATSATFATSVAALRTASIHASDTLTVPEPALPLAVVPGTPGAAQPTQDGLPSVSNLEPLPQCALGDVPTPLTGQADWPRTLVDTNLMVPSTYVPDDLVGSDAAGFSRFFQVRDLMVPDLRRMGDAAAAAGAPLGITSAYRSYDTQVWTFWYWVGMLGHDTALLSSARPGHSEHQLGLAIDFKESGGPDPWAYHNFAQDTAAGAWLAANAWKYGFIMSYPYGSTAKSCYGFEPWHYRYVGVDEAAAIHASGLTTREWMWHHQPNPEPLSPMPTLLLPTVAPGTPGPSAGPDAGASATPPTGDWPAP